MESPKREDGCFCFGGRRMPRKWTAKREVLLTLKSRFGGWCVRGSCPARQVGVGGGRNQAGHFWRSCYEWRKQWRSGTSLVFLPTEYTKCLQRGFCFWRSGSRRRSSAFRWQESTHPGRTRAQQDCKDCSNISGSSLISYCIVEEEYFVSESPVIRECGPPFLP